MRRGGIGNFEAVSRKRAAQIVSASTAHLSAKSKAEIVADAQRQLDEQLQSPGDASPEEIGEQIASTLRDSGLSNHDARMVINEAVERLSHKTPPRAKHVKIGSEKLKIPPQFGDSLRGLTTRQRAELLEIIGSQYGWNDPGRKATPAETEACLRDVRALADTVRQLNAPLLPIVAAAMPAFARMAKEWTAPPGKPKTPGNFELLAMNALRTTAMMQRENVAHFGEEYGQTPEQVAAWLTVQHLAAEQLPSYLRLMDALCDFWNEFDDPKGTFRSFGEAWLDTAFARLEIGHRLAASLCLTDVPTDIEIRAPWPAWSLVLPDGLFGAHMCLFDEKQNKDSAPIARIWCVGTEPRFAICSDGTFGTFTKKPSIALDMLDALIRGACLALSNPREFSKERLGPNRPGGSKSGDKRKGPPDLQQARFLLSAPVKVDFRQQVHEALAGTRKGGSPTVQFLVRGHWRQQTHGPKHSLRKTIWVNPFFKGPEDTRVLLRSYKVDD